MASLYQRFTGKINTSRSFPAPPEASRLLGGQGPEEDAGPKPLGPQAQAVAPRERGGAGGRPRFQYQARSDCDEEDVRASWWVGGGGGSIGGMHGPDYSSGSLGPLCQSLRSFLMCQIVLRHSPWLLISVIIVQSRSLRWWPGVGSRKVFGAAPAGMWTMLGIH